MQKVCINYKDQDTLRDECEDARRLGYDGKQAIHPSQVEIIQNAFLPTAQGEYTLAATLRGQLAILILVMWYVAEIRRAVEIVRQMEMSHQEKLGAFGLDDGKGGKEMIDAPMLKQVSWMIFMFMRRGLMALAQAYNVLRKAKAAKISLTEH